MVLFSYANPKGAVLAVLLLIPVGTGPHFMNLKGFKVNVSVKSEQTYFDNNSTAVNKHGLFCCGLRHVTDLCVNIEGLCFR